MAATENSEGKVISLLFFVLNLFTYYMNITNSVRNCAASIVWYNFPLCCDFYRYLIPGEKNQSAKIVSILDLTHNGLQFQCLGYSLSPLDAPRISY